MLRSLQQKVEAIVRNIAFSTVIPEEEKSAKMIKIKIVVAEKLIKFLDNELKLLR